MTTIAKKGKRVFKIEVSFLYYLESGKSTNLKKSIVTIISKHVYSSF